MCITKASSATNRGPACKNRKQQQHITIPSRILLKQTKSFFEAHHVNNMFLRVHCRGKCCKDAECYCMQSPLVDAMCADTERDCSGVVGANYLFTLDMQLGTYSWCECKKT